ncbi:biotin/lipoyl-binding protein [Azospirillum sp. RWY-5-1]|uniref:Biotin/lipoyl-binding protein n=1 Tax=Azospirillum oleiclasticum TaxID=2735135 RepID=A0ABX2TLT8_9PROT|nr:biotin/lipoyl-containing protein [Azospirillum oleiclasticum]NYZ17950.1 biotin/lipoyl-binding protein [Azospirillum oleiclasticum]NYZ25134.1 biotin/lipoyl-binding protein [Azospirillum oleiclasticum]
MRRFRITVEGVAYEVSVEELDATTEPLVPVRPQPPTAPLATAPASPAPAAPASDVGAIASPLAGVVVSVAVTVGDRVEAGQPLLVLEAMKMQTTLSAPRSGTVAVITVAAGAAVQEGQSLLTLR